MCTSCRDGWVAWTDSFYRPMYEDEVQHMIRGTWNDVLYHSDNNDPTGTRYSTAWQYDNWSQGRGCSCPLLRSLDYQNQSIPVGGEGRYIAGNGSSGVGIGVGGTSAPAPYECRVCP